MRSNIAVTSSALIGLSLCVSCTGLFVALGLQNDTATLKRSEPAAQDLASISTIAIATLQGRPEDVTPITAALGELLAGEGRYQLVERERFETLQHANGCNTLNDFTCVARALPASAVLLGSVVPAHYRENIVTSTHECEKNKRKAICSVHQRHGDAAASATLRLVEPATGKVLYQKFITKQLPTVTTQAYDGDTPPPIDSFGLLETARRAVSFEFFASVSPHPVLEKVELETDSAVPELEQANDKLKAAQFDDAMQLYRAGLDRAKSDSKVEPKARARAYYGLALGFAATAQYDDALANMKEALSLHREDDDWVELQRRLQHWKTDAENSARQLAFGVPSVAAVPSEPVSVNTQGTPAAASAAAQLAPTTAVAEAKR